jgi:DNA-binding NarL/FixJ family response regulator
MSDKICVLLADDHAVARKDIRQFLEESGGIEVIGFERNFYRAGIRHRHRSDGAITTVRFLSLKVRARKRP